MLDSIPIILEPVPIQKLSKERANPKKIASLESIFLNYQNRIIRIFNNLNCYSQTSYK